ncbi:hypothetical protein D7004_02875 [Pedobacter jejuensis]|uniref:Uncharacterized protein n=1 Tax=Pedobacter jejuensis TaxID=1268550 RepID=A0A3N0C0J8_9SPHI|nr:hypothetical protein D7004_02875 [Pedobacter jejuensis]
MWGFFLEVNVQHFIADCSPAFRYSTNEKLAAVASIRLINKGYFLLIEAIYKLCLGGFKPLIFVSLSFRRGLIELTQTSNFHRVRFFLEVTVQHFIADCSPAFRCKPPLRYGLFTAIRLINKG